MKPTLTVLIGAGGSVELGVPSTASLTSTLLDALSSDVVRTRKDNPIQSVAHLAGLLTALCRDFYGRAFNFEHLLHVLETMEGLGQAWHRNTYQAVPDDRAPHVVEAMFWAEAPPAHAPLFDLVFVVGSIEEYFHRLHDAISGPSGAAAKRPEWPTFASFWRQLDAAFDLTIATLNYDDLIEQALALTGEDQGFTPIEGEPLSRFDARLLREGPKLMHLHGGIHFGYRSSNDVDQNRFVFETDWEEGFWFSGPGDALRSRHSRSTRNSQAARKTTKGPFITGLNKADKLLVEPYDSYHRVFANRTLDCERLLVVGYGFGDLHITPILQRMTKYHGPRRRVVSIGLLDPAEMHGSWEGQNDEQQTFMQWFEEREPFDRIDDDAYPMEARNGRARLYYRGLLDVARSRTAEVIDFLLGVPP